MVKSLPRATTSSNSKRLQRRISSDFVPIFDLGDIPSDDTALNTNQLTPETKTNTAFKKSQKKFRTNLPKISSLPRKRTVKIQPRGEGYRKKYRVINDFPVNTPKYSAVFHIKN